MQPRKNSCRLILFILILIVPDTLWAEGQSPAYSTEGSKAVLDFDGLELLDLKTAQRYAIAQNPTIEAAHERIKQARQQILQARSRYWFRVDADVTARHKRFSDSSRETGNVSGSGSSLGQTGGIPAQEDFYDVALVATYTLFDGFDRKFSNLAARYREKSSREALLDLQRLLLAAVAESYYQAQLQKANVAIAEADKSFNQRQATEAKARRRVGTGSLSDVLNFEVQVNTAQTNLLLAQREYEIALYGLAALLGIPGAAMPSGLELEELRDSTDEELMAPYAETLIQYAEKHRPDVLQAGFLIQEADSRVGSAKSEFYPQIDLFASLDGARTDNPRLEQDNFGHSVGFMLTYNIFAGGLNRAQLSEARSRKKEIQNLYRDTLINVRGEVRESVTQVLLAQEQLVLQRASTDLSQQNRDLVEKEYNAGQASLVRLNEAQRDLTTAQSRLVLSLVALRRAWKNLEAATGEILVPYLK
jgi:outer membrane protein TolC